MRASDRPRTLYAGTGTLNELVGVAVRASLAFARVSGGMGASPRSLFQNVHDVGSEDLRKALRYLRHDAAAVSLEGRRCAAASSDPSQWSTGRSGGNDQLRRRWWREVGAMNTRTGNRISGMLGMLASLWATVGILASNVGALWKILIGPFAVWLFLSSLLQFLGTRLRRKGQDKHLKE